MELILIFDLYSELAAEVLFDSSSEDEPGLHEMIHNIVARVSVSILISFGGRCIIPYLDCLQCPLDLRKKLFSRLLVVGGLAHIPGLLPRLKVYCNCDYWLISGLSGWNRPIGWNSAAEDNGFRRFLYVGEVSNGILDIMVGRWEEYIVHTYLFSTVVLTLISDLLISVSMLV